MVTKSEQILEAAALREKAEASMQERSLALGTRAAGLSPEDLGGLIHELQVHQIELEMQNNELRRIQALLHTSRARYFDLYDLAPVGYCTLSAEGVVLEANLEAIRMLGLSRIEFVKQPLTRFLLPADQDIYYLHRKKFLEGTGPHSCEVRMVRGDGSDFWAQLTSKDVTTARLDPEEDDNAPLVSRLILSDISELKAMEEERLLMATQLQKAKKLETLGVLAAGIAHEFSGHLTTILGSASTGGLVAEGNCDLSRFFETIETSALQATETLRQLMAFAGKGKWAAEEVDLNIILKEICQSLTFSLPWNIAFTCEMADRVPYWRGDSAQAFLVVMNLVLNSFEAFPEGAPGAIALRSRSVALPEDAGGPGRWVLPAVPGRYVMLEVQDTGRGMTPEVLAQSFEPFFTTKASGRGLGLAAVLGILGSHGGGLWADSRLGRGTTLRIFLPAMAEEREDLGGEALTAWRGQGMILVVDLERVGRGMARALAETHGFSVLEARGGLEAIELFRLHHSKLTLVLLDRGLKGTSASEAFKVMQNLDPKVPVVFTDDHRGQVMDHPAPGQAETLQKPYRPAEFQGVLERAVQAWAPGPHVRNGIRRPPPTA